MDELVALSAFVGTQKYPNMEYLINSYVRKNESMFLTAENVLGYARTLSLGGQISGHVLSIVDASEVSPGGPKTVLGCSI